MKNKDYIRSLFTEMKENMKPLFKQFCAAYGIKKVDYNDTKLINAFQEWYMEEKYHQDIFYDKTLKDMRLDFNNQRTVEVGKTIFDSIVLPYETKIVTPYGDGFEKLNERVIVANLKFYGNFPTFVQENDHMTHAIPVDLYQMFMTQNPYSRKEITNWNKFPFQDVIVGAYGDVNDCDRQDKMRLMDEFYSNLDPSFNPRKEFVASGYNWAEIITTNRKR